MIGKSCYWLALGKSPVSVSDSRKKVVEAEVSEKNILRDLKSLHRLEQGTHLNYTYVAIVERK